MILNSSAFILISLACSGKSSPQMFHLAILASILIGFSQGFGEAVFLGFLKGFPSHMIGYTSSGTGAAGILATGFLLLARFLKISNQVLFLIEVPTVFIYFFAFEWLDRNRIDSVEKSKMARE